MLSIVISLIGGLAEQRLSGIPSDREQSIQIELTAWLIIAEVERPA
jgi:hypothetical protein